jgi:hypothetical protein
MKRVAAFLLLFTLFAFKGDDKKDGPKQPCITQLDGKAYSFTIDSKKPSWTFYFLLYCEGDSLRGVMLGPSMQPGGNPLFFRSYVNNVRIDKDSISFNFIEGQLFRNSFTLSNYNNYGGPLPFGFAAERLFYKGVMKGDSIIDLKCQSKYHACAADSIVLKKMK